MKVQVKMDDVTIELGNKGVVLRVSDNAGKHIGDLRIGRANVEWRKTYARAGTASKIPLGDLIEQLESKP